MKITSHTSYQVVDPRLSWKSAEKFDTLKEAVNDGKEMNQTEIERGYKPSKWIVVKEMCSRTFDDDGTFVSESSSIPPTERRFISPIRSL